MNLKEWSNIFLKQRDIIKKEIADIQEIEEGFIIHTKNGEEKKVLVMEELKKEVKLDEVSSICTLNNKKNVVTLVNNWKEYAQQENLLIVFVHPQKNEKWLLKPYHHEKISDNESLKQGLLAMHDAISTA